jgi:hypothetical protein
VLFRTLIDFSMSIGTGSRGLPADSSAIGRTVCWGPSQLWPGPPWRTALRRVSIHDEDPLNSLISLRGALLSWESMLSRIGVR